MMSKKVLYKYGKAGIITVGLLIAGLLGYQFYRRAKQEYLRLQAELTECRVNAERAVLVQRVSKQMEEIAYQQKDIAEKRRQEAVAQTYIASRMQRQAEIQRGKALLAQTEAEKAYQMADTQRKLAMERQRQAEYAKRQADTLAFLALGRSLGSMSGIRYQTGNTELAALLAYAAWKFTRQYGGDVFQPAIFGALARCSRQNMVWFGHTGALSGIAPADTAGSRFVTVGKYGKILRWEYDGEQTCRAQVIAEDSGLDYRSIWGVPGEEYYALSYTGDMAVVTATGVTICPLPVKACKTLIPLTELPEHLLIVSDEALCLFDCTTRRAAVCYAPVAGIDYAGCSGDRIYVFLKDGSIALVSQRGRQIRLLDTCSGSRVVTAFCALDKGKYAVGCRNGEILLCNAEGEPEYTLAGHRSAVTALLRREELLFSASYDRTLRLWDLRKKKAEPAVILTNTAWIHTFCLCPDGKHIFMGDEQGRFHRIAISPDYMANAIRCSLSRDFTPEEWEDYIGPGVSYESYMLQSLWP